MPVINFSYHDLCELIGREVSKEVLKERLPMLGAELKSVEDWSDDISFEFFPDRPDLFSVEGIARALRAFLGYDSKPSEYEVTPSEVVIDVDPSVNEVRPYIWSALVEGNRITDALIRSMMDLQEKLHLTLGRNRRKVAIGIHDYRRVKPPFAYKAVLPDEVSFIPLQGSRRMTPAEILKEHEKGITYAFVLDGKPRYPLIIDSLGEVLSFPPVINGVTTAITEDTTDIFVDCTGTDLNAVQSAVNILTTALAERGAKVRSVDIRRDGTSTSAPDLGPKEMVLESSFANAWLGTSLGVHEMVGCLKRTGHAAEIVGQNIRVEVPAYRADVLHPVDLAEDVAIGHGFERFGNVLPRMATFAREDPLIVFARDVRGILVGLGFFEVVTLSLSNQRDQAVAGREGWEKHVVHVRNPVSEEHVLLRVSLIPSLMTVLRKNKHRELPQKIFEIGDIVIDLRNRKLLSGVAIHARASFTEVKSVVQSVLAGLGLDTDVRADEHPSFVSGRCASALVGEKVVGTLGELSPAALEKFDLKYPGVAFELDLEELNRLSRSRGSPGRWGDAPKQS